jgi:hypothetical protein
MFKLSLNLLTSVSKCETGTIAAFAKNQISNSFLVTIEDLLTITQFIRGLFCIILLYNYSKAVCCQNINNVTCK